MSEGSEAEAGSLGECKAHMEVVLGDMKSSNQRLQEIISYCQTSFEGNAPEVFQQTQQYATDAVLNAAYHTHRGAEGLMEYLNAQMKALDKITSSVESVSVVRCSPYV